MQLVSRKANTYLYLTENRKKEMDPTKSNARAAAARTSPDDPLVARTRQCLSTTANPTYRCIKEQLVAEFGPSRFEEAKAAVGDLLRAHFDERSRRERRYAPLSK